ncbi:hypothetical protein [Comamonas sp. JC664]|uniref:hypothetical protein n=1 Tax=Comamonas sp. JC664 TaxID=2801917 RepID=UPI00174B66EB|nr:hypothetical protein [Comamonas sp. JC664]MBL0698946.1 hypothetical protein [Comamonas sp. JC664]GHG79697.1 hypothetical protein GCM10012319_31820 [Comamonas sp. KCTC 72670]
MKIVDADITRDATGPVLKITAYSPTLGWKNVALEKAEFFGEPVDGIQEFVLFGTAPAGPAPTSIQMYSLSVPMPTAEWVKGARIRNERAESLLVLRTLVKDQGPIGDDWVAIESAGLRGDKLIVDVRYGGGCRHHSFQLSWDGAVIKADPPQVVLSLSHNSHGDTCKALRPEQLQFDLSLVLERPTDFVLRVNSGLSEAIAYTPEQ